MNLNRQWRFNPQKDGPYVAGKNDPRLTTWINVDEGLGSMKIEHETSDRDEAIARTRLAAAAPALLAALHAVLVQVIQGPVLERDACIAQARQAYKLATDGE